MTTETAKPAIAPSGPAVQVQAVIISCNGMLTLKNAALYLGISENTLRWWINYEKCPFNYYKIGGRVMFKMTDLDEYVNQQLIPVKTP